MSKSANKRNIEKLLVLALQKNGGFYINQPEKKKKSPKKTKQSKSQKKWYDSELNEEEETFRKEDLERVYDALKNLKIGKEFIKNAKKIKLARDPLFRFSSQVRDAIRSGFRTKGFVKSKRTEEILGCSFQEFKTYIESKWKPWMNWDNYGNNNFDSNQKDNTWDLDHITPISTAKTMEDVIRLNHYTNLQPLCSVVNRFVKSDNILN